MRETTTAERKQIFRAYKRMVRGNIKRWERDFIAIEAKVYEAIDAQEWRDVHALTGHLIDIDDALEAERQTARKIGA